MTRVTSHDYVLLEEFETLQDVIDYIVYGPGRTPLAQRGKPTKVPITPEGRDGEEGQRVPIRITTRRPMLGEVGAMLRAAGQAPPPLPQAQGHALGRQGLLDLMPPAPPGDRGPGGEEIL